jgi:hypothetical protein
MLCSLIIVYCHDSMSVLTLHAHFMLAYFSLEACCSTAALCCIILLLNVIGHMRIKIHTISKFTYYFVIIHDKKYFVPVM